MCLTISTFKFKLLEMYLSDHARTSLFDDCVGVTQGVQLLDRSDPGQVQAITFRRVWKC